MKHNILQLLSEINNEFENQLISTDATSYVDKLLNNANLILHIQDGNLIGLIAYYANDEETKTAFLSMIAVKKEYRVEGIGKMLFYAARMHLKRKAFCLFRLEVLKSNYIGKKMYDNLGFSVIKESELKYLMSLDI